LNQWPSAFLRQIALAVKAKQANAKRTKRREVLEVVIRRLIKQNYYL